MYFIPIFLTLVIAPGNSYVTRIVSLGDFLQLEEKELFGEMVWNRDKRFLDEVRATVDQTYSDNSNYELQLVPGHLCNYMKPFIKSVERGNSLVVINNYRGIDIPELLEPIILKNLEPAFIIHDDKYGYTRFTPVILPNIVLSSLSRITDLRKYFPRINCTFSALLSGIDIKNSRFEPDICGRIDFFEFIKRTKPWNNLVEIELFPSPYFKARIGYYPILFEYKIDWESLQNFKYAMPSTHSQAKIYVDKDGSDALESQIQYRMIETLRNKNKWKGWRWDRKAPTKLTRFFLIQVGDKCTNEDIDENCETVNVEEFFGCSNCGDSENKLKIGKRGISNSELNNGIIPLPNQHGLYWNLPLPSWTEKDIDWERNLQWHMFNQLEKCGRTSQFPLNGVASSTSEKIGRAYAHVLISIMGNFTYVMPDRETECSNGKLKDRERSGGTAGDEFLEASLTVHNIEQKGEHSQPLRFFPVVLEDFTVSLRFVSCGRRGISGLAFEQLVNVYEDRVWYTAIGVIATWLVISTALQGKLNSGVHSQMTSVLIMNYCSNLGGNAFRTVSTFLEQGGLFEGRAWKKWKMRWSLMGLLLATVVLSNAYKNSNVYNMIIPRKSLPYKYFDELIAANYSVYTKSSVVQMDDRIFFYANQQAEKYVTPHEIYVRENHTRVSSDVAELSRGLGWASAIKNNSQLHKQSAIMLKQLLEEADSEIVEAETKLKLNLSLDGNARFIAEIETPKRIKRKYEQMYREREAEFLLQLLEKCDDKLEKVALLMNAEKGEEFAHKLIKTGMERDSDKYSIGEETYFEHYFGFSLDGLYPQSVIWRIRWMESSGIWGWWDVIAKSSAAVHKLEELQRYPEPLKKPTMEGNVLLIFILLLVGNALAGMTFLVEFVFRRMASHLKICQVHNGNNSTRIIFAKTRGWNI